GRIDVLVESRDPTVAHRRHDACGRRDRALLAHGPEDVLLEEPAGQRLSAHDLVVDVAHVVDHPPQDVEVGIEPLLDVVEVVPEDDVGRVHVAHTVDIALLDAIDQSIHEGEALASVRGHDPTSLYLTLTFTSGFGRT